MQVDFHFLRSGACEIIFRPQNRRDEIILQLALTGKRELRVRHDPNATIVVSSDHPECCELCAHGEHESVSTDCMCPCHQGVAR